MHDHPSVYLSLGFEIIGLIQFESLDLIGELAESLSENSCTRTYLQHTFSPFDIGATYDELHYRGVNQVVLTQRSPFVHRLGERRPWLLKSVGCPKRAASVPEDRFEGGELFLDEDIDAGVPRNLLDHPLCHQLGRLSQSGPLLYVVERGEGSFLAFIQNCLHERLTYSRY